jgi:hypothetical protein
MTRGPRQGQMGVVLSDEIRAELELAATQNGCSIGEEIRRRLSRTFKEDAIDEPVRNLMAEVAILALMTELQTGKDWRTHPGANAVMRHAFTALLARTKESGPETFAPGELPRRFVAGSDDPHTIGVALEARLQGTVEHHEENIRDLLLRLYVPRSKEFVEKWSKRDGTS